MRVELRCQFIYDKRHIFSAFGEDSLISEQKAQDILFASVYFRELFKRTLFEATPESITTKTQINILVSLFAHKPMNISSLNEVTGLAREQITRAVKILRKNGLVKGEKRPENRREVIVSLSPEGHEIIQHQLDEARTYLNTYLDGLTQDEINELADISAKAIRIFEKAEVKAVVPSSPKTKN